MALGVSEEELEKLQLMRSCGEVGFQLPHSSSQRSCQQQEQGELVLQLLKHLQSKAVFQTGLWPVKVPQTNTARTLPSGKFPAQAAAVPRLQAGPLTLQQEIFSQKIF